MGKKLMAFNFFESKLDYYDRKFNQRNFFRKSIQF